MKEKRTQQKNLNFYIDDIFASSIINTEEYKKVLNEL